MPFRRRGFSSGSQRSSLGLVINSNKNVVSNFTGATAGTKTSIPIADAQDSAVLSVVEDVERGCVIKAIWVEFWVSATAEAAVGVTHGIDMYLFKNPGQNLTSPIPRTVGSSNEKKFIFKI